MTTDIHALIAAAKRFEHCDVTNCCNDPEGGKSLMLLSGHCIAMAEALARIAARPSGHHDCDDYTRGYGQAQADVGGIARECLDKIVKEANRD